MNIGFISLSLKGSENHSLAVMSLNTLNLIQAKIATSSSFEQELYQGLFFRVIPGSIFLKELRYMIYRNCSQVLEGVYKFLH